tara:strand:+ start:1387 stop:2112 length:726 start_codon:yes stop_codon:yes gene_type:complete
MGDTLIAAATTDGYVYNYVSDTWANVRNAASGTAQSGVSAWSTAIKVLHSGGRGGDTFWVSRAFFAFDTSGIDKEPYSATLRIYGYYYDSADVIAVRASKPDLSTGIAGADFDAIPSLVVPGWNDGISMLGSVTDYSNAVTSWSTSGYNNIGLNAEAREHIAAYDVFSVCIVEFDHDYRNVTPSEIDKSAGMYFRENTGTSKDPHLDINTQYIHTVSGVDPKDIDNVMGVGTLRIGKVSGI